MAKNKKKPSFIDDGRTIANMNVEGMPGIPNKKTNRKTKGKMTSRI